MQEIDRFKQALGALESVKQYSDSQGDKPALRAIGRETLRYYDIILKALRDANSK